MMKKTFLSFLSFTLCLIAMLGGFAPGSYAAETDYADVQESAESVEESNANPCADVKINVCPARNFDYLTKITIKASAEGLPTGYYLAIYIDGEPVSRQEGGGEKTTVAYDAGKLRHNINYTVKVTDAAGTVQTGANGKPLSADGGTVKCVKSFFKVISAIFRDLFGTLPEKTVEPNN